MDILSMYTAKEDLTLTLYINKIRDEEIVVKQGTKWQVFWYDDTHVGLLSEESRTNITITIEQLNMIFEKENE